MFTDFRATKIYRLVTMPVDAIPFDLTGDKSLLELSIREMQRQLDPRSQQTDKQRKQKTDVSLSTFVESTSDIILEPWQNHMCDRLEKLKYQKGQRILLHKPPQHGGSVIVSQRLPAYLIGHDPIKRVRLACYNIEHASKFCGINKSIMQSMEYKSIFPDDGLYIPYRSSDEEFYTVARKRVRDAQASLKALGLVTGFVGQGADDLVIDDPYASPQAAASPAIRQSTWTFWVGSAKVRIDEDTNVIVMFHRYGEEDFAGQLIAEEGLITNGGRWELISYRAEWDGDERLEVGGPDPIGREKGEYLSPRKERQPGYYEEQKRNPKVWQSQFQGKPSNADGDFFVVSQFKRVAYPPCKMVKVCRAYDLASSVDGDWTVGVKMGLGTDGRAYVLDVSRFRETTDERNRRIKNTVRYDAVQHPGIIKFRFPQDPNSAGKDVALSFRKLLIGYDLEIKTVGGDKELRADPWSQYVNAGLAVLVYDGDINEKNSKGEYISWVKDYIEEHRKFPNSTKKDQIDASADAFSEIALEIDSLPGESFDLMGLSPDDGIPDNMIDSEDEMFSDLVLQGINEMSYERQNINYGIKTPPGETLKLSTISQRKNAVKTKSRRVKLKRPD